MVKIIPAILISVLLLTFCVGIFAAVNILKNETNIDITKADINIGRLKSKQITYEYVRRQGYQPIFTFMLDNSDRTFVVNRLFRDFSYLRSRMNIGDSIKVYSKKSGYYRQDYDALQVERNGYVIENYTVYNSNAITLANWILLGGIGAIVFIVISLSHFNIFKFLDSLVDVK